MIWRKDLLDLNSTQEVHTNSGIKLKEDASTLGESNSPVTRLLKLREEVMDATEGTGTSDGPSVWTSSLLPSPLTLRCCDSGPCSHTWLPLLCFLFDNQNPFLPIISCSHLPCFIMSPLGVHMAHTPLLSGRRLSGNMAVS